MAVYMVNLAISPDSQSAYTIASDLLCVHVCLCVTCCDSLINRDTVILMSVSWLQHLSALHLWKDTQTHTHTGLRFSFTFPPRASLWTAAAGAQASIDLLHQWTVRHKLQGWGIKWCVLMALLVDLVMYLYRIIWDYRTIWHAKTLGCHAVTFQRTQGLDLNPFLSSVGAGCGWMTSLNAFYWTAQSGAKILTGTERESRRKPTALIVCNFQ